MKPIPHSTAMEERLASSWIFRSPGSRTTPAKPAKVMARPIPRALEALKNRGWRGGRIAPHRAFAYLPIGFKEVFIATALVVSFTYAWLHLLVPVGRFWGRIFTYWTRVLHLEGNVVMSAQQWTDHARFNLPYVAAGAGAVDPHTWRMTGVVTLAVFAVTYFISEEYTPWMYLLRFLVLISG